jgi:nitroreductase
MLKKVMSWVKGIIPSRIKSAIIKVVLMIFSSNKYLSTLYYFFFSRNFDREHNAVLAGRLAYHKSLTDINNSPILLRRNIHRIEKGLIMKPRRDIFAESYIMDTVLIYERAVKTEGLCKDEMKWFTDVLSEYFSVVKDNEIIARARKVFKDCRDKEDVKVSGKFVPYSYEQLPEVNITYDDLRNLFLKRRAVRWYDDKKVPLELVEKAVDIATLAPSACNRIPYSLFISSSKKMAVDMAKCAGGTVGFADNLPCVIAIIGDLSAYPYERDRHLIYVDGSLAAMQLMLAFETLGLSSCPINWPDVDMAEEKLKTLLNLKDFERPIMLMAVGYADIQGGIPYSQKKKSNIVLKQV